MACGAEGGLRGRFDRDGGAFGGEVGDPGGEVGDEGSDVFAAEDEDGEAAGLGDDLGGGFNVDGEDGACVVGGEGDGVEWGLDVE